MRTRHTAHPAFPVYAATFVSNDLLVLAGGGGFGKTGVNNRVRLYRLKQDEKFEQVDELELGTDDAPMSIAPYLDKEEFACGINSPITELQQGQNKNCRVYSVKGQKIKALRKRETFQTEDGEDYQKVTTFSPDHDILAVGSTKNEVSFLWYNSFERAYPAIQLEKGQLHDATISPTLVVIASSTHLQVYSLPKGKKGKGKAALNLVKTVEPPTSPVPELTFRNARFHPKDPSILYTVLNTSPKRTRARGTPSRHAYVCKWDTNTWKVLAIRKVADKGATCFDVSSDGKLLALGSSDYAIRLLDGSNLAPLLTILKAHEMPPTALAFNPDATLLVSGSADRMARVIVIPSTFGNSWSKVLSIIVALLILLAAFALQRYGSLQL